jgi:hypothetical protein
VRIDEAQREMRRTYLCAFPGAFVTTVLWAASAAFATWGSRTGAVMTLIAGGMFIFPATLLVLRLLGRPAFTRRENPLNALAMQVAFTVPLSIPLILAATRHRPEWFYAGFLIVVGAHYLPFMTLYGHRAFLFPAVAMLGAGFALPVLRPGDFAIGGWAGTAILLVTGVVLVAANANEQVREAPAPHSP